MVKHSQIIIITAYGSDLYISNIYPMVQIIVVGRLPIQITKIPLKKKINNNIIIYIIGN